MPNFAFEADAVIQRIFPVMSAARAAQRSVRWHLTPRFLHHVQKVMEIGNGDLDFEIPRTGNSGS